uniref:Uncharacterized protein n=1 Tax=Anguilla anguilla TaxID=7936 RepID=A0A0E9Q1S2_ANGAN
MTEYKFLCGKIMFLCTPRCASSVLNNVFPFKPIQTRS